jgi:hypothetical protein
MIYQLLTRPVEITSSNNTLAYTMSGGGGTVTLTAGVWANPFAIADAIRDAADLSSVYVSTAGKIVVTGSATVTPTHSELWRILGFSGNETPGTTITADYTPLFTWIPTYTHMDSNQWAAPSDGQFFGSKGSDGNLSGISVEVRRQRALTWDAEISTNVFPSTNTASYTDSVNGLTRPASERSFWTFINGMRTAGISAATANNVNPKGCYYIEEFDQFTGASPSTAWPEKDAWGDGDTYFCDANNTSTYVFCNASNAAPMPSTFIDNRDSYYKPSCTLNTAEAPTWESSAAFA